jgi:hypothetical protein
MTGRFKVDLGGAFDAPRIIENMDEAKGRVVEIPENYRRDADTDLRGLLKDALGYVSGGGDNLWFENQERVRLSFKRPATDHIYNLDVADYKVNGSFLPEKVYTDLRARKIINPNAPRFVHIDMARSTADLGFCMGHCSGWMHVKRTVEGETSILEKEEVLPIVYVDFSLQILPNGKDVDPSLIRNLVLRLIDLGYPIKKVSGDDYGFSSLIELRRSHIDVELLVVTNGISHHTVFRTAVYDGRFNTYEYLPGLKQMLGMRKSKDGQKVEKPASGIESGVENAYCGVVWWVNKNSVRSAPSSPSIDAHTSQQSSIMRELRHG